MKLLWEIVYQPAGSGITSTPFMIGDSLVVMAAGRELLLIEQSSGTIRWRVMLAEPTDIQTDQFSTDGTRIFATHVEDIRAYNISSGSLAWLTPLTMERGAFFSHTMCYQNGKLLIAGYYKIYCLDALTGTILWSNEPKPKKVIYGVYAATGNVFFGGNYSEKDSSGNLLRLIAQVGSLSITNGDSLWTSTLQGNGGVIMQPVFDSTSIFVGTAYTGPSSLEAFNPSTGQKKWAYFTPSEFYHYSNAISVGNKIIANAGYYNVCALDKNTGALLWRTFILNDAESRKIHYYNGYVYHTHAWKLFVLNPETGAIVYSMKPQGKDLVTIAVGNNRVFVQGYPSLQCYEAYKP